MTIVCNDVLHKKQQSFRWLCMHPELERIDDVQHSTCMPLTRAQKKGMWPSRGTQEARSVTTIEQSASKHDSGEHTVWQFLSAARILHQMNTKLARSPGRVVCSNLRTYGKMPTDRASSTHHAPMSRNCPRRLSALTLCTYISTACESTQASISMWARDATSMLHCIERFGSAKSLVPG